MLSSGVQLPQGCLVSTTTLGWPGSTWPGTQTAVGEAAGDLLSAFGPGERGGSGLVGAAGRGGAGSVSLEDTRCDDQIGPGGGGLAGTLNCDLLSPD